MMSRREMLSTVAAGVVVSTALRGVSEVRAEELTYTLKGKTKQSVSKWCFGKYPLQEFCPLVKKIGLVGVDLIDPKDWDLVREQGLVVTMGNIPGAGIGEGFNKVSNHAKLIESYEKHIPLAAEKGVPNVICFSGNRAGISDDEGMANCVAGLQKILPLAEKHKVNVCMELLNSKRNHKDYQCDKTPWGAELCKKTGSERMKLLYDIYHMQIMEGDIINIFRECKDFIGHVHTGGNPGRRDIDDSQEIYYPFVIKSILDAGYSGYIAHEFMPKNDLTSLRKAIEICDV